MPGVYARVTAASIFIVVIAIALGFAGPDLTNLALQKLTYAREKIIGRMDRHPTIVVVGSGLAGSCAALAAADANLNARIILLEKEVKTGGNSMKASSGINALDPEHDDSIEDFISDTMASGGGRSNAALVETLVRDSPGALAYLRSLGVELAGTVQLGGHTNPRTHFPAKGPNIGAAILRVLGHKLAEADRIQIITGAKVRQHP